MQRRIPFVAVRVVLDEAGDALPPGLDVVDERGDVRFGAAMRAAVQHPRVVMQILRHSQIAATMNIYSEAPNQSTTAALRQLGTHLQARCRPIDHELGRQRLLGIGVGCSNRR